jgi:dienelactone hydrolase
VTPPDFREKLLACLGGPFPEPGPLHAKTLEKTDGKGFRLEKLTFESEPGDPIPAFLLIPDAVSADRPAPGICIWHQHNGEWHLGKSEPAGLAGNPMHHTGAALAREGYVVLCIDALGFEEREQGYKHKGGNLERFLFLKYVVAGKSMAWKNIVDMRRAVDYLVSRAEVQADRLGCYGHSMGSTHAWLVGPWEPRLKAIVGNCCLPTYAAIHHEQLLHCFPNFIPGIYEYGDTPDIASLIAPRALHLNFGETDGGSPIEFVRKGIATIERTYESMHEEKRFSYFIEKDTGHVLSDEMWRRTQDFFARELKG